MKKLGRVLRFAGLVFLIFLACLGMGIAGGVPISFSKRKRESENKPETEYVERSKKATKKSTDYHLE